MTSSELADELVAKHGSIDAALRSFAGEKLLMGAQLTVFATLIRRSYEEEQRTRIPAPAAAPERPLTFDDFD